MAPPGHMLTTDDRRVTNTAFHDCDDSPAYDSIFFPHIFSSVNFPICSRVDYILLCQRAARLDTY